MLMASGPDEHECRCLVDAFYRESLPLAFSGRNAESAAVLERFEDMVERTAYSLGSEEAGVAFLLRMERVRDDVYAEYRADREAFLERLGLYQMMRRPARSSAGAAFASVAADTAVRATVWEGIRALFRVCR